MVSFRSLLLAATGALALPFTETHARGEALITSRAVTENGAGEHGGFYYYFWSDGAGTINYQNKDNGSYDVSWQDCSNFIGGKGWNPGTPRTIHFDATMNATGNNYLTVYGWMLNPRVEYYIIESFGSFDPAQHAQAFGTYDDAEGSTYKLSREIRYSQLPMEGATLHRIFASRRSQRLSGSVDVGAHLEAWKAKGLKLGGTYLDLIMAVEGYQSSGEAAVIVW